LTQRRAGYNLIDRQNPGDRRMTMAGTYFEDRHGNEHVTFSNEEWEAMLADPAFGYVCSQGHRLSDADHRYGACMSCEADAERAYEAYEQNEAELDRIADLDREAQSEYNDYMIEGDVYAGTGSDF
jgi:hypothetical protein